MKKIFILFTIFSAILFSFTAKAEDTSINQPPIADAGNDIIAFIDQKITFDGSRSYDPDGFDLAYEWNLGEGGVENDIIVSHKYSYPGTYLIALTVFDGKYYARDIITVRIYPMKITINEFLPNPVGKDAGDEENPGEWIELYNDSDQIIDISGWQIDDAEKGSKPFTFPQNTLIAPKSYLVFSRKTTGIALNNKDDKVRLLLSTGIVFQEISYTETYQGQSSARTPQGFVWSMPTPGLPNIIGFSTKPYLEDTKILQSETTKHISENVILVQEDIPQDLIQGGWTYLSTTPKNNITEDNLSSQSYYNLENTNKTTGANDKIPLIILTVVILTFAIGLGITKLKKKH